MISAVDNNSSSLIYTLNTQSTQTAAPVTETAAAQTAAAEETPSSASSPSYDTVEISDEGAAYADQAAQETAAASQVTQAAQEEAEPDYEDLSGYSRSELDRLVNGGLISQAEYDAELALRSAGETETAGETEEIQAAGEAQTPQETETVRAAEESGAAEETAKTPDSAETAGAAEETGNAGTTETAGAVQESEETENEGERGEDAGSADANEVSDWMSLLSSSQKLSLLKASSYGEHTSSLISAILNVDDARDSLNAVLSAYTNSRTAAFDDADRVSSFFGG